MKAGVKPPLIAGLGCALSFVIVRLYAGWTCNGQQPRGIKAIQTADGAPASRFGCIDGYTTDIGVALNALTFALPVCAISFLFMALIKHRR